LRLASCPYRYILPFTTRCFGCPFASSTYRSGYCLPSLCRFSSHDNTSWTKCLLLPFARSKPCIRCFQFPRKVIFNPQFFKVLRFFKTAAVNSINNFNPLLNLVTVQALWLKTLKISSGEVFLNGTSLFAKLGTYAASMFIVRLFFRSNVQLSLVPGLSHFLYHLYCYRNSLQDKWMLQQVSIKTVSSAFALVIRYHQDCSFFMPRGNRYSAHG